MNTAFWLLAHPTPTALPAYLASEWHRLGRDVFEGTYAEAVAALAERNEVAEPAAESEAA